MTWLISPAPAIVFAIAASIVIAVGIRIILKEKARLLLGCALCVVGAMTAASAMTLAAVQASISHVLDGVDKPVAGERWNIALLATDRGVGHDDLPERVDSIAVLSIGLDGASSVLFTVPRDLQRIPLPRDSPVRETWPSGVFDCQGACQLSALFQLGESGGMDAAYDGLVPKGSTAGIEALRDGLRGVTGLEIDNVVAIEGGALARVVDALGGVRIDVRERLPIGGDANGVGIVGWIEPGTQTLDGFEAEWYARSRMSTSNADRMDRQVELIKALLAQKGPLTLSIMSPHLAAVLGDTFTGDLSVATLAALGPDLIGLAGNGLQVVPLVASAEELASPDYEVIHGRIDAALAPTVS